MKFGLYLWLAIENMYRNKLRTLLTLLGLIVGIASVVVMTGSATALAPMLQVVCPDVAQQIYVDTQLQHEQFACAIYHA